jgi:NAD(P)-dependent dehydrogenase (short-subunit alcohol dehydrogenase family)
VYDADAVFCLSLLAVWQHVSAKQPLRLPLCFQVVKDWHGIVFCAHQPNKTDMSQTIFITGASSGIGKATALYFANKGWQVIATMRNVEGATDLHLPNITLLPLDVTDAAAIEPTIAKALSIAPVDVVLNNAGYGFAGPLEGIADEQLTRIMNTNLLGVIRITKAFLPHFRERGRGVFIAITSIGGLVAFPFFSLYHATKWALEGWSESLWYELKPFGIQVKTVEPGYTRTDFGGRSLDKAASPAYDGTFNQYIASFLSPDNMKNASAPDVVAEVVYEAATDGKDQLRYLATQDAQDLYKQRQDEGDAAFMKMINDKFLGA